MANDNIVSLRGGPVNAPEPDPGVIEVMEDLLRRARSGELNAIAYAVTSPNGDQATGWAGASGTRHPLGTGIMMLHSRYAESLRSGGMKD